MKGRRKKKILPRIQNIFYNFKNCELFIILTALSNAPYELIFDSQLN